MGVCVLCFCVLCRYRPLLWAGYSLRGVLPGVWVPLCVTKCNCEAGRSGWNEERLNRQESGYIFSFALSTVNNDVRLTIRGTCRCTGKVTA
jgi:hypothetical protein